MEEIVNKVAGSGLIQVDLLDYLPKNSDIIPFDFAPFLWEGLVLREKEFRANLKEHDWSAYENKVVYLFCSTDAILPSWAFLLVNSYLSPIARLTVAGDQNDAKQAALIQTINELDLNQFADGKLIVKGCSELPDSSNAMITFFTRVQTVCSSIMFGEPCSTVPIFKRKK
jgi:hypothetical protein